jgi:hypothetical protein
MGLLGDFLEALYRPGDRYHSIRAEILHWRDQNLEQRAGGGGHRPIGRRKAGRRKPRIDGIRGQTYSPRNLMPIAEELPRHTLFRVCG